MMMSIIITRIIKKIQQEIAAPLFLPQKDLKRITWEEMGKRTFQNSLMTTRGFSKIQQSFIIWESGRDDFKRSHALFYSSFNTFTGERGWTLMLKRKKSISSYSHHEIVMGICCPSSFFMDGMALCHVVTITMSQKGQVDSWIPFFKKEWFPYDTYTGFSDVSLAMILHPQH